MARTASVAPPARPQGRVVSFWRRLHTGDDIAYGIVFVCATSIIAITCLLVYELWINSAPARFKFGFDFLVTSTWDPIAGQYGALPFIFGTVVTSVLALLIGIPLGVAAAIFLAHLAPPL